MVEQSFMIATPTGPFELFAHDLIKYEVVERFANGTTSEAVASMVETWEQAFKLSGSMEVACPGRCFFVRPQVDQHTVERMARLFQGQDDTPPRRSTPQWVTPRGRAVEVVGAIC